MGKRWFAPVRVAIAGVGLALAACGGSDRAASSGGATTTLPVTTEVYPAGLRTNPAWAPFQADDPVAAVTEIESYRTVEDQAAASSTVLRGRIRSVTAGRVLGQDEGLEVGYATLSIEPDLVLAGDDPVLVDGAVRLELPAAVDVALLQGLAAGEPSVFFLRHKADEARALGFPADAAAAEHGYYRLVSSTGLVTADQGRADVTFHLPSRHNPPIVRQIEALDMATFEHKLR